MDSLIILIRYYSWINLGGIKGGFMRLDNIKVTETTKITETTTELQPTALPIRLITIGLYTIDLLKTPIDHFWADL